MKTIELPRYIAIEGIDGAGKATQAKLLAERLNANGFRATVISFPRYNTVTGEQVLRYLEGEFGNPATVAPRLAANLYALDRKAAADDIYKATSTGNMTLNEGIVIFDRWVGSNLAHQAAKIVDKVERDFFIEWVEHLEYGILGARRADVTVFLDIEVSMAVDRADARAEASGKRPDGHEDNPPYLEAARQEYRRIAKEHGWKTVYAHANGEQRTPEAVAADVLAAILTWKLS